jgi:hypothetical protein
MPSGLQVVPPTYCIPVLLDDVTGEGRYVHTVVEPERDGCSDGDGELLEGDERSS